MEATICILHVEKGSKVQIFTTACLNPNKEFLPFTFISNQLSHASKIWITSSTHILDLHVLEKQDPQEHLRSPTLAWHWDLWTPY